MKLPKNRESGQALIMALILLALGSLLVVPLLGHTYTNLGYHQSIECKTVGSYTADSGVEYVLCKLYNKPGLYIDNPLQEGFTLNNRSVNVTAEYQGEGIYKVTSVATGGGCGSTKITCYINLSAGAFAFVISSKDSMTLEKVVVDSSPDPDEGNIHSNGNIDLVGGQVLVNGSASAVGAITGEEITGMRTPGSSEVAFPGDYSALYEQMAKEGGPPHTGDLELKAGDHYLGPLYIDGNLYVKPSANVTLEGTVYVTGSILVENARFEGREQVAAEGDVTIHSGSYASEYIPIITAVYGNIELNGAKVDAVVYAPNGTVTCRGNIEVYGAVGGKDVWIENASIIYAEELHGREDIPGGELHTIAYSFS